MSFPLNPVQGRDDQISKPKPSSLPKYTTFLGPQVSRSFLGPCM